MLISGIIGEKETAKTSNLISSILSKTGKKISVVELNNLSLLDFQRIKTYIEELINNNIDILVIRINYADLDNSILDYFKFDVVIYTHNFKDLDNKNLSASLEAKKRVLSLMNENGVSIASFDDIELVSFISEMKKCMLTYGFNSKASITASSTGDMISNSNFICCLQKTIFIKKGMHLGPQEFQIKINHEGMDVYNILAAVAFVIVNQ